MQKYNNQKLNCSLSILSSIECLLSNNTVHLFSSEEIIKVGNWLGPLLVAAAEEKVKDYVRSEISCLTAIALGSKSKENYLLLSQIKKATGDLKLYKKYLDIAQGNDSNEQIIYFSI